MKQSDLTKAVGQVIALKLKAIDRFVEEVVEPLSDVGNPEKLIGRPYETWTPEDLQRLAMIYGPKEPNALSNLIFTRKLEEVKRLEGETNA